MPSITPANPVTELVNLNLEAIALCNEGANSRAHILLTKRKENKSMSFEEFLKALNSEQAELVNKHIEEIAAAKDKTISELNEQVIKLTTKVEEIEKSKAKEDDEDIFKNIPPEVKAHIEKLQSTVNSLVQAQEEVLANERFMKVKALPVEETELKTVLKSVSPAVFAILEKAAKVIENGLIAKGKVTEADFQEETEASSYAKLEKVAKEIMKENTDITFEQAFTLACEKDIETYKNYVKGVN